MIHISSVVFLVPALFIQWYSWILKLYICCYGLHHVVSALQWGNSQLDYPSGRCGNQAERRDCSSSSVSEGAADALICTSQLCRSTERKERATPRLPPSRECRLTTLGTSVLKDSDCSCPHRGQEGYRNLQIHLVSSLCDNIAMLLYHMHHPCLI